MSPNFVTGILGAIALILAFIGFGSLPLNVAGLLLIGLGIVLFVLEFSVVSHGLLFVGGLVCFVLGAFALYTAPGSPTAPDVAVATPLIVLMATLTGAFMLLVLVTIVRSRRRGLAYAGAYGAGGTPIVPSGSDGLVKKALAPLGIVYTVGEEWSARSASGAEILAGESVRVVGQDGLTLIVEPAASIEAVRTAGDNVTSDQILPGAIVAVIVILIVVGVFRAVTRRRGANEDTFGAGGVSTVEIGTRGVATTDLNPSGVVRVVSEEWTAKSANGSTIVDGTVVRVVRQDGLTLFVEPMPAGSPAQG